MSAAADGPSRLNVFLVFGVQQLLAVRAIIERGSDADAASAVPGERVQHHCLLYIDEKFGLPLENCTVEYAGHRSLAGYLRRLRQFRAQVDAWRRQYSRVCIYLPHAWYYPANYLLFADLPFERYLIPDGVINYCEYPVSGRTHPSMWLRWLLGCIGGLRYTRYAGHITAYAHPHFTGVYTFNPRGLLTTHPHTVHLTPSRGTAGPYRPRREYCLFLDHFLQDVPKPRRERMINAARAYIDSLPYPTVYVKAHPTWNEPNNAVLRSPKVELLDRPLPAEWVVEELQPGEVVSYASSALALIADTWPDCPCTAVGLNLVETLPDYAEVRRLFGDKGIRFIDAD